MASSNANTKETQGDKGNKVAVAVRELEGYIKAMTDGRCGTRTSAGDTEKAVKGTPLLPIYAALQILSKKLFIAERAALHGFLEPQQSGDGPSSPFETLDKQYTHISESVGNLAKVSSSALPSLSC